MTEPRPGVGAAEIHRVALPLLRPHRTAGTDLVARALLLVRLSGPEAEGWGECAPVPGYSTETLEDCLAWLAGALPHLLATGSAPPGPGPPAAAFALETAAADLASAAEGVALWRRLGGTRPRVAVGAVIGLGVPAAGVGAAAASLAAEGYRRIKLKVAPGDDRLRLDAARGAVEGVDLAVDANGSYDPDDPPLFLDGYGLCFVEQPFPAGAWEAHAAFARLVETPVCLDESITGVGDAVRALDTGAASMLSIKPARIGGLMASVAVHDAAVARGAPVWCGGMVEAAIGKAASLAVASLPGMTLPADLPPSGRHFAGDLADVPWEMEDGHLALRDRAGLGVRPDPAALAEAAVEVARFGR